jgi:hypothetical protein
VVFASWRNASQTNLLDGKDSKTFILAFEGLKRTRVGRASMKLQLLLLRGSRISVNVQRRDKTYAPFKR